MPNCPPAPVLNKQSVGVAFRRALQAGDAAIRQNDLISGLRHFISAIQLCAESPIANLRAGIACWLMGDASSSRRYYEQALRYDSQCVEAHHGMAEICLAAGQAEAAVSHARRAVELAPANLEIAVSLGFVLQADGREDEAWEVINPLLGQCDHCPRIAVLFARLAPKLGCLEDALARVTQTLSGAKRRFAHEISSLHFAAATLLDKLGRYDEAFVHAGEAQKARGIRYDARAIERMVDHKISFFTPSRMRRLAHASLRSSKPVFIVGMPRSGTSLIEQVLACHPSVHGAGELDTLGSLASKRSSHRTIPMSDWEDLSPDDVEYLASNYLAHLEALAPEAARITDKQPFNFLNLELVALLFPGARVIHCQRNPLDTCLSCYLTEIPNGNPFTVDLHGLGHFYRQYQRLMRHWKQVLEIPVLEISYEQTVEDLEMQSRRMLAFLDLPWDAKCLKFHESRRLVATASNAQVREPLYRSSVDRWTQYAKYLGPLRTALEQCAPNQTDSRGICPAA